MFPSFFFFFASSSAPFFKQRTGWERARRKRERERCGGCVGLFIGHTNIGCVVILYSRNELQCHPIHFFGGLFFYLYLFFSLCICKQPPSTCSFFYVSTLTDAYTDTQHRQWSSCALAHCTLADRVDTGEEYGREEEEKKSERQEKSKRARKQAGD